MSQQGFDKAYRETDRKLKNMERRLKKIYSRAQKELIEKANEFFSQFREMDEKKKQQVEDGEITKQQYITWRTTKLLQDRRWRVLCTQIAEEYTAINQTALAYINGELPTVYSVHYNACGEYIESKIQGYSFEMVDQSTVMNLINSNKSLLPKRKIDIPKDIRWNTRKINSAILQGILQGENINDIAKRLRDVTSMTLESSIRNARTAVTSAECKGRQDSYERAKADGVIAKKVWLCANDTRVRPEHKALNNQEVDISDSFEVNGYKIRYPGDPLAAPEMVYNCRCTMYEKILGFKPFEKKEE